MAVKPSVFPTSNETFNQTADELVKEMLVGTGLTMTFVVLLCPQDARKAQDRNMQPKAARETNLPMDPSK